MTLYSKMFLEVVVTVWLPWGPGFQNAQGLRLGGQHIECWKGLGCFEDMQAVLFVVSLSAYDEAPSEEPVLNQLQESMKLFSSVCNTVFFQSTSLVLFLNKINLLQKKILHLGRHLRLSFPQYTNRLPPPHSIPGCSPSRMLCS